MLIDEVMPDFDFATRHQRAIAAPAAAVHAEVRGLDLGRSLPVRVLFALRGLPALLAAPRRRGAALGLTLDGLLRSGFVLLGERDGEELVLGLVGRFWTPAGTIVRLDADGFRDFRGEDYAKAVWGFRIVPTGPGRVRLVTETRVHCLGAASRRRFRAYWLLVRPLSGLVRRLVLREIARAAESRSDSTAAKQTAGRRVS